MSQISRLLVLLLCFLIFTVFASAQARWTLVATDPYGLPFYVDESFTLQSNGIVLGWQKSQFPPNDDYPVGSYSIVKKEWNCRNKESRQLQGFVYDQSGKFIEHTEIFNEWRNHPPGSIGDVALNYVCRSIDEGNKSSEQSSSASESFAEITKKSNLMTENNSRSKIIRKVAVGERLTLLTQKPIGEWYQVIDPKTDSVGWLNGNHFKIVKTGRSAKGGRRAGKRN